MVPKVCLIEIVTPGLLNGGCRNFLPFLYDALRLVKKSDTRLPEEIPNGLYFLKTRDSNNEI